MEQQAANQLLNALNKNLSDVDVKVVELIRTDGFDVNWRPVLHESDYQKGRPFHGSLLILACISKCPLVVAELLKHPNLDFTAISYFRRTALRAVFQEPGQNEACLRLLVTDPRVDFHQKIDGGAVLEYWGMTMGTDYHNKSLPYVFASFNRWRPDEVAEALNRMKGYEAFILADQQKKERLDIIRNYQRNPWEVIRRCREMIGWQIYTAVEYFLLMVLLSDGYFELTKPLIHPFFNIAKTLPQELQMVIARRIAGLSGSHIPGKLINNCLYVMVHHNKSLS